MRVIHQKQTAIPTYPMLTSREPGMLVWSVHRRIKNIQEAASECSTLLRQKQRGNLLASQLIGPIAFAEETLIRRLDAYVRAYGYDAPPDLTFEADPVFHVLNGQEYRFREGRLIERVNDAVQGCSFFRSFDLSNVGVRIRAQSLRDALGDVCAAAEHMLGYLESHGIGPDEAA